MHALVLVRQEPVGRRTNSSAMTSDDDAVDQHRSGRRGRAMRCTPRLRSGRWPWSKLRLNQPKKPRFGASWPWSCGFSSVAHSAGVRISATSTDSAMAETMVIENWR